MPWQSEVLSPDYTGETVAPQVRHHNGRVHQQRATTIYGGTAEIQRGIIAKHVLGL